MVGLIALAILMHRIQNLVVPPRSSSRSHPAPHAVAHRFVGYSTVRRIYRSILPLNLNRTSTRLAFFLPTLYFLCKMLLIWTILLLQTAELFPSWNSGYIHDLGQWVQHMEMHEICWRTFASICAAFSMEAFVRGLDGGGLGLIHMNSNTTPFNLIGYAFLLHVYSSPITHVFKPSPSSLPSRPDKHVIVTITIPLLQVTALHLLAIKKRWSNHRLGPTALSSFLSLLHFHATLYSHLTAKNTPLPLMQPKVDLPLTPSSILGNFAAPTPPPVAPVHAPTPPANLYSRPTGSASFPLLNYVPNAFETVLILTITLTVVLNALTQLILTGSVSRPLLGLGLHGGGTSGAWVWAPPYDEDWGVVLLRVGTASLEATGLRGWGNELPAINAASPQYPEYGAARLGPSGVLHVSNGYGAERRSKRRGLANEVREVDVGAHGGSRAFGADLINFPWLQEAWRFLTVAWQIGRGFLAGLWTFIVSGGKVRGRLGGDLAVPNEVEEEEEEEGVDQEDAVYGRFLRQEEISDDEDDPAPAWDLGESSESEGEHEEDQDLGDAEAVGLFADLGESTSAPVLLAHMASDRTSPLTRRQYGSLLDSRPSAPQVPLPARAPAQPLDEARRNCVICVTDARSIICWPCRCLSMCDGCREVLASRSTASKHRCPCCRQVVEGYSRIFIP